MNFGIERIFEIDPWSIGESEFKPEKNAVAESIFSLANEYMGTRGFFEEGYKGNTYQECFIGGIYLKETMKQSYKKVGVPTSLNYGSNTTNWITVQVKVNDESFTMGESDFSNYYRSLDMKTGVLKRELVFKTKSGEETYLSWERFISYEDVHIGSIRLSVKALNHNKKIEVSMLLDGRFGNQVYAKDEGAAEEILQSGDQKDCFLLMKVPSTGHYYIHNMHINSHDIDAQKESIMLPSMVGKKITFVPEQGREYKIDKIVSVWTSRDAGYPYGLIKKEEDSRQIDMLVQKKLVNFLTIKSKENLKIAATAGYDSLKQKHIEVMAEIWDKVDIEIQGDALSQQGIRYSIFQLTNSYRGFDSFLNVNPKGLTSEFYQGRYFWDTESYCLPFYLFTNPDAAKGLIEFRYNTLESAKERATEFGYKGAMYPWNTIDGSEDCPDWVYWGAHINGIIPYAIYIYSCTTGDEEYLFSKGIEVLIEESRFWASRASFIAYRDGYCINRVSGPDEHQYAVNNNFYTNYMAKFTLEYTINTIETMQKDAKDKLDIIFKKLEFDKIELKTWLKIAEKLILNYDKKYNIFVQDDMFLSLSQMTREELDPQKDIPIDQKWPIEKFLQYDLIKQPDTLLAMLLFRNKFSFEEKLSNYTFYEQRTTHGSSLSPCVHSILASEIGLHNQAYEYYLWASRLDLDDFNQNTYQGLHTTAMAGSWMNLVYGFGGLVIHDEMLEFKPTTPVAWESFSFKLNYRSSTLKVTVNNEKVHYQIIAGEPIKIKIYETVLVAEKEQKTIEVPDSIKKKACLEAVIFDLDGVIVDTAKYHYKAWKLMADNEGIYFDEIINERLKGVSRTESLKIIMEKSNREYTDNELKNLAAMKNTGYVKMLEELTPNDILPGIIDFIKELKTGGIKLAIFSASKNTDFILEKLKMKSYFDTVVTGNDVQRTKPDPEGFILAAKKISIEPKNCAVIEDAFAGIEGAKAAKMQGMGIGDRMQLYNADYVLVSTKYLTLEKVKMLF